MRKWVEGGTAFEAGAWSRFEADEDSFHCGHLELEEVMGKPDRYPTESLLYESGIQERGDPDRYKIGGE